MKRLFYGNETVNDMPLLCPYCHKPTSSATIKELRRSQALKYRCKGCDKLVKLTDLRKQTKQIEQTFQEFGRANEFITVIMFSDVSDFTKHTRSISDTHVNKLMEKHEQHAQRLVARHAGWFWRTGASTGDQTRAFFRSPNAALTFARQLISKTGVDKFDVRVVLLSGSVKVDFPSLEPQRSTYFTIMSRMMEHVEPREIWICERTKADLDILGGVLGNITWKGEIKPLRDIGEQMWWKLCEE